MKNVTSQAKARKIAEQFREIQKKGGHAAIDFRDGKIVLQCTMPQTDPKTWGKGAVPQKFTDEWVRICEC